MKVSQLKFVMVGVLMLASFIGTKVRRPEIVSTSAGAQVAPADSVAGDISTAIKNFVAFLK